MSFVMDDLILFDCEVRMDKYINKIINADCMDILKELPDKCIDLLCTDPPYAMNFQSNYRQIKHKK